MISIIESYLKSPINKNQVIWEMNIGIIISAFVNGGAQRVALTLAKWIGRREERCCIIELNCSEKNQYEEDGVELIRLPFVYPGESIIKRLRSFDRDNQIDVYIVMGVPMCMYVIPALNKTKAKIIVSERNDPRNFQGRTLTKVLSRWLMNRSDGFVFQTNDARNFYKKFKSRSVVIPNPVAEVPIVEERLLNKKRKKEIVTAGRLVPQKNHEMLIRAFGRVSEAFLEYKLIIYGEGNLKNTLIELCEELGISDRVVFPGAVNDLHKRIVNSELFVLSSDFEGMPNALMEAMAMGLTCISTDCPCGGPNDLIVDGENGYLIPVGDVEMCAEKMKEVLRDKEVSDLIGKRALDVRDRYSEDIICKRWLDYIASFLNSGG